MPTKFSLKLADGSSWQFIAFGKAKPWLRKLARIMKLKKKSNKKAVNVFVPPVGAEIKILFLS